MRGPRVGERGNPVEDARRIRIGGQCRTGDFRDAAQSELPRPRMETPIGHGAGRTAGRAGRPQFDIEAVGRRRFRRRATSPEMSSEERAMKITEFGSTN